MAVGTKVFFHYSAIQMEGYKTLQAENVGRVV